MKRVLRSSTARPTESTSADSRRRSAASSSKRQTLTKRFKAPRIGDVITIDDSDFTGFVPPPSVAKSKHRRQTGTEIVLEDIVHSVHVIDEDDSPKKSKQKQKAALKSKKKPVIEDQDVILIPGNSMIEKGIKNTAVTSNIVDKTEKNSFTNIWEAALKDEPTTTRDRSVIPLLRPTSVIPVPRPQPMHFLNKFTGMKLPLSLPRLKPNTVSNNNLMLFSSHETQQHFKGTVACSKLAGNILHDMIVQKSSKDIFCLQIPNSLKVFTNANSDEMFQKDIEVAKQNVLLPIDSETSTIFSKTVPKVRQCPTTLVLNGFSTDKPFGKLQLLKSGKVVLRIGSRVLNVASTNIDKKNVIAAIIDVSCALNTKTEASQSGEKSALFVKNAPPKTSNSSGNQMHVLGPMAHTLVASFSYDRILETMPCCKPEPVVEPEVVDLTNHTPAPQKVIKNNSTRTRRSCRITNKKQSMK